MKTFLFSSEILPPVSSFMFVYLHERNLNIFWHISMCLQYLTQERGILPVSTSLSPSDSFILMNQMSHLYWFLIGNLFYDITTKTDNEEDMKFLNRLSFLSWSQHQPRCWDQKSLSCWHVSGQKMMQHCL